MLDVVEYLSIYRLVVSLHESVIIDLGVKRGDQIACESDHIFSLNHSSLLSFQLVELRWDGGNIKELIVPL